MHARRGPAERGSPTCVSLAYAMIHAGGSTRMAAHACIRVLLVDRHSIVLWGLQKLIERVPEMEVVATAADCASAIALAGKTVPDVVVLDSHLLRDESPADIPTLLNRQARVLIYSDARDSKVHEAAVLRGACGVVHKDEPLDTLLKAIAKVHEGQLWLDRCTTGRIFVELSRQKNDPSIDSAERKLASLTGREQDVVRMLVTVPGADNRKLASSLSIGEHTLRNHLSRIYDKLGVPNRLELYVFAQRHGLSGQRAH
ncbi:MAG: response regulator transcription factor [Burkholderiales bacterium]